jgi:hypothetical protein
LQFDGVPDKSQRFEEINILVLQAAILMATPTGTTSSTG